MAAEALGWKDARKALTVFGGMNGFHATRVENMIAQPGFPDVNGCLKGIEFHLENKGMFRWPKVSSDRVIIPPHGITIDQIVWHRKRWYAGGNNWICLSVRDSKDWLIWNGPMGVDMYGNVSKSKLYETASLTATGAFPASAFYDLIRRRQESARSKF